MNKDDLLKKGQSLVTEGESYVFSGEPMPPGLTAEIDSTFGQLSGLDSQPESLVLQEASGVAGGGQGDIDYSSIWKDPEPSLAQTFEHALDKNPEEEALKDQLSKQLGLKPEVVAQEMGAIQKKQTIESLGLEAIEQQNPKLAAFLADPTNAAIMQEDLDALKAIDEALDRKTDQALLAPVKAAAPILDVAVKAGLLEDETLAHYYKIIARSTAKVAASFPQQAAISMKSNPTAIKAMFPMLANIPDQDIIAFGERLWEDVEDIEGAAEETFDAEMINPDEWLAEDRSVSGFAKMATEQVAQSLPYMVVASKSALAMTVAYLNDIQEERMANNNQEGEMPTHTAETFFLELPASAGAAILEKIGAMRVFKWGDVVDKKSAVKEVFKALGAESATEAPQEFLQYAGGSVGTERGFDLGEGLKSAAWGAVLGGTTGGMIRTPTAGIELLTFRAEKKSAEVLSEMLDNETGQAVIDQVVTMAQSTTSSQMAPEKLKEFLDDSYEQKFHISSDGVDALMEAGIEIPNAEVALQMRLAQETGGYAEVSSGELGELATSEAWEILRPHVKRTQNTMTLSDMESNVVSQNTLLEEAQMNAQQKESMKNLGEQFTQVALDAGSSKEGAKRYGKVLAHHAVTMSHRLNSKEFGQSGYTPEMVAADMGLKGRFNPEMADLDAEDGVSIMDQDFGGIEVSQEIEVEGTGEVGTMTESPSIEYKLIQTRNDSVNFLRECMNA